MYVHFKLGGSVVCSPRKIVWNLLFWDEPREEASHESQSKLCFAFSLDPIPSNTGQECVATTLKICSFSGLRNSCLCSDREVRAGTNLFRRYVCFLPTSEGSVRPSQVKTLVWRSLGLPDLFCWPWNAVFNSAWWQRWVTKSFLGMESKKK